MKSEKRPVAIEDLLRLKRAERPPAEFWARFDRELRAKQLSALVAKRPWWQRLPRTFTGFGRYSLPLGAAAVLTVTFVSLREQPGAAPTQSHATAAGRVVTVAPPATIARVEPAPVRDNTALRTVAAERLSSQNLAHADVDSAAEVVTAGEFVASHAPAAEPLVAAAGSEFARGEGMTGLRYIGPALTVAAASVEPKHSAAFLPSATHGFEARVLPGRTTVEPLQQITPPGERTRHKILTAMMTMSATDLSSRTGERAADRLSEERLYDQVSRFGARGAGVSMKF